MAKLSQHLRTINKLSNTVSSEGIKHWLFRGTLLGTVRENALLPNADRFHFCYMENQRANDVLVHSEPGRAFEKIASTFSLSLAPLTMEKNGSQFVVGYKLFDGPLCIEFHACKKQGSDLFLTSNPNLRFKYYFVDELEHIEIDGCAFPSPRYVRKLCALLYGPGWQSRTSKADYYGAAFRNGSLCSLGDAEGEITGYAEGVFDLFHVGHLNLFKRGKDLYDHLLVGVETDERVTYKRKPTVPYEQRLAIVRACKYVDAVIERPADASSPDFLEKKRTLDFYKTHNIDYELAGRSTDTFFLDYYSDVSGQDKLHLVSRTDAVSTTDILKTIR